MSLIWQVIISVLLAFLLLCIISIIDFNRWYKKDKEIKNLKGIIPHKGFKEILAEAHIPLLLTSPYHHAIITGRR